MPDFVGKNLEKRYVEVGLDGVEVGVDSFKSGNEGFPLAPHAVFVGGKFSRDGRSARCLHNAKSTDEIISGLGCASCQGCSCG